MLKLIIRRTAFAILFITMSIANVTDVKALAVKDLNAAQKQIYNTFSDQPKAQAYLLKNPYIIQYFIDDPDHVWKYYQNSSGVLKRNTFAQHPEETLDAGGAHIEEYQKRAILYVPISNCYSDCTRFNCGGEKNLLHFEQCVKYCKRDKITNCIDTAMKDAKTAGLAVEILQRYPSNK